MEQGTTDLGAESPGPVKLCECGCGRSAPIATRSNKTLGYVKGRQLRFIQGHSSNGVTRPPLRPEAAVQMVRLCECGCGRPTPVARKTKMARGQIKGQPIRFIHGHRPGARATPPGSAPRRPHRRGPHGNRKLFVETGRRFGRSVVVGPDFEVVASDGSRVRAVHLRCDCGAEYIRKIKYLFSKSDSDVEYCGKCLTGPDLAGQRFGRLTAIQWTWIETPPGAGEGGGRWLCKCDCGNEVTAPPWALLGGKRRSCGCSKRTPRPGNAPGDAALRMLMRTYQTHAKNRDLSWCLAEDEFRRLTSADCHYCGIAPGQTIRQGRASGSYVYNGVDRLDNTQGYFAVNVVPCCKICNHAKKNLPYDEFMAWIARLASFHFFRPDMTPVGLLKPPA